ncbi:MAG: thymidylate synthase [Nanoarchaeota archaeon]
MDWPLYEKENVILGNPGSNVGIVTLWSPRKIIADNIDSNLFSAMGQLYFNGGINFLLRNCLANKQIRYIIIAGQDLAKSGETLLLLKEKGIDEKHKVIDAQNAQLQKEIAKEAIDNFRNNVEIIDMRGKTPVEIATKIQELEKKPSYGEPETFPETKIEAPERFPSDPTIHKIREKTIGRAWLEILYNIMRFGATKASSYGGDQKELINISTVITEEDPDNFKWEDYFQFTKEELEGYIPQVTTNLKIPDVNYTYGQRLFEAELKDGSKYNQIQFIIDLLRKKPHKRSAIAFTWNYDKDAKGDEPPCISFVHCLVQDDALYMTSYIRSNDMYEAWPRNALALRKLQSNIVKEISKETSLKLGTLTIISGSAHIYEKNWTDAKDIIGKYRDKELIKSSPLGNLVNFKEDPKGNFIIKLNDGKITVTHIGTDGSPVNEYKGKVAGEIIAQLANNNVLSEISHALDLGSELQKAEIALKTGKQYTQDKPL